jgi:hypothetical protein
MTDGGGRAVREPGDVSRQGARRVSRYEHYPDYGGPDPSRREAA